MLPDFTYPVHWHEYYEIFLVLEGKVQITIDGAAGEVSRGDIVAVDPGQVHGFPRSDGGTRLRIYQFEGRIFSKDDNLGLAEKGLFCRKPILCTGSCPGRETQEGVLYTRVYEILDKLHTEYKEKTPEFRLAVKAGLYLLALAYLRVTDGGVGQVQFLERPVSLMAGRRLERVFLLIYRDFSRFDLDLDAAAREAAMSRFYFARFFKQETGQSFHDYLTTVRLSHAKELLVKSDLPVMEIAGQCGFASLPTFHRVFKGDTGCSPARYRENEKAIIDIK